VAAVNAKKKQPHRTAVPIKTICASAWAARRTANVTSIPTTASARTVPRIAGAATPQIATITASATYGMKVVLVPTVEHTLFAAAHALPAATASNVETIVAKEAAAIAR
jgi:hypothetical protein